MAGFDSSHLNILFFSTLVTFLATCNENFQFVALNLPYFVFSEWQNNSFVEDFGIQLPLGIDTAVWGLTVSILSAGGIVGCLVTIPLADGIGRKWVLFYLVNFLAIAACVIQTAGWYIDQFYFLIVARFLNGISIGSTLTMLPIYITEICSKDIRGILGSLHAIVGFLAAILAVFATMPQIFGNSQRLELLLLFEVPFALLFILIGCFSPESAKYTLRKTGDRERVNHDFRRFYSNPMEVVDMSDIDKAEHGVPLTPLSVAWRRTMDCPSGRLGLKLSFVVGLTRNFSGTSIIESFSMLILAKLGLPVSDVPFLLLGTNVLGLVFGFVGMFLVHMVGRRKTLLTCILLHMLVWAVFVCLQFVASAVQNEGVYWSFAVLLFVNTGLYNCGCGIMPYFMASELVVQDFRKFASSASILGLFSSYLLVTLVFPPLNVSIGPTALVITLIVPLLACFLYLYWYLPETKNKSILEVTQELEAYVT